MAGRPTARGFLDAVLDPGSWVSWDAPIAVRADASSPYRTALERARSETGEDEAVITGQGRIGGHPVALIVSEFGFLGGSIGVDAADRVEAAIRRATHERLPLLAAPASGGTRMQEGTLAFVQMVRITAAIVDHKEWGVPYLVYARHPTTGGVFASWASLGHVTIGEPGALLGFLGPGVYQALHGVAFPPGIQRAENLLRHGLIDDVVAPDALAAHLAGILDILATPAGASSASEPHGRLLPDAAPMRPVGGAWDSVQRTREPGRFGLESLIAKAATGFVPLLGTVVDARHSGLVVALARLGGMSCVIVGQERDSQREHTPLGPDELRAARRGFRLAGELSLPLITVIDTPGAILSAEAEEGGLGAEIARCLADLLASPAPLVSLLLGEGTGGGALALLPADRVLATEHAWLAPLPPEGASAITHHGDTSFAATSANAQGITAWDLRDAGIVDAIIPDDPDHDRFAATLAAALADQAAQASAVAPRERIAQRPRRYGHSR